MGFFTSRVKNTAKTFGDWMNLSLINDMFQWVKLLLKNSVVLPTQAGQAETFEEAVRRLNLSEQDIVKQQKAFVQQTVVYFLAGCAVVLYAIFLAANGWMVAALITFLVAVLAFAYAFRSHFWFFQVKSRRLGCTLKDYLNTSIRG